MSSEMYDRAWTAVIYINTVLFSREFPCFRYGYSSLRDPSCPKFECPIRSSQLPSPCIVSADVDSYSEFPCISERLRDNRVGLIPARPYIRQGTSEVPCGAQSLSASYRQPRRRPAESLRHWRAVLSPGHGISRHLHA